MRKLLFVILLGTFTQLYSQDIIVKVDSTRIDAKVISINDKTITYKRFNSQDGPEYEVSRRYVARIEYKDGTVEHYGYTANEAMSLKEKNFAGITLTDVVSGVVTVNYERTIAGKLGVRAVGSFGLFGMTGDRPDYYTDSYYYNRYKVFSAGLDVHYTYYTGRNISLYAGSLIEFGRVRTRDYIWDFPPYGGPSDPQNYYFGGITNGIKIHTGTPIDLDMFCTVGWRQSSSPYSFNDYAARVGLNVGYRF